MRNLQLTSHPRILYVITSKLYSETKLRVGDNYRCGWDISDPVYKINIDLDYESYI